MNKFMEEAIRLSEDNIISNAGGPFGACIVKNGEIIGRGSNHVLANNDPTAHAEIMAIRDACNNIGSYDLKGCELYTSCYPCPMCLSAIIWANIKKVYYANTREDADAIGFRDDLIYKYIENIANDVQDDSTLNLQSMNREEAIKVFERYNKDENKITY